MNVADVGDFRLLARRRLPRFLFEYIDGGSYSETTMRRNVEDLQGIGVRQRVLCDVADISLSRISVTVASLKLSRSGRSTISARPRKPPALADFATTVKSSRVTRRKPKGWMRPGM